MLFCEGFLIILFPVREISNQTLMLSKRMLYLFSMKLLSESHQKKKLLYIIIIYTFASAGGWRFETGAVNYIVSKSLFRQWHGPLEHVLGCI